MNKQQKKHSKRHSQASFYQVVWRWHFYAGAIFAPFLLIIAFSGGVYLFKPQLESLIYQDMMTVTEQEEPLTYTAQVDAVKEAYPNAKLLSFMITDNDHAATEFQLSDHGQQRSVFVNPYSGAIQGEIEKEKRFSEVFKKIHSELFVAGTVGNLLVELAACWAVILLISGLYLWWPRNRKSVWGILLPRFRKKGVTFWRDLHAVPAFWLSAFILILIATGLPWSGVLGEQIQKVSTAPSYSYNWQEKPESIIRTKDVADNIPWANENLAVPASTPSKHLRLSIEDVAYVAQMNNVEKPYTLSFPTGKTGVYTVSHDTNRLDLTTMHIDQYSGAVLTNVGYEDFPFLAKIVSAGIALHEGRLFGWPNQILGLITCVGLIGIMISSFFMWRKRSTKGFNLPPKARDKRATRIVFFIMLAGGIVMPLVGISIIFVFLLDRFLLSKIQFLSSR